ncbi:uncharacterized protein LOC127081040 [Lathyrus oleraceus]|uniref:uncharacterized protein LOC127081040 n=1 Tax=Pisum sativum TaxID=3888 RepID=UPI0021CF86D0|nr:uncharacterized protein LOC127081040 [Pisum sativum]
MKGKTPYNRIGQVAEVEKLALTLPIPISDALANWKKRENLFGFWRAYLEEEEAERLFVIHHWDALANILALLIYGLLLFPTHEGFIDSVAISVFWAVWKDKQSLVPPLLAGTFRNLNTLHQKKNGMLICCLPLLYNWLISYVFKPNAHISEMSNGDWARTLVSLSSKDIIWYRHKLNIKEIIVSYGSFPNVPLIGSKGCISYNPMLALRQFGYPMCGKPDDKELEEMVLKDMGTNDPVLLHKIIRSWEKVEKLRAMVARLGKENWDLQSELYKETGENMILNRKSNQRKELLKESRKKNRIEKDLKERVLECLDQADSGLGSLHDQLAKAKREGQKWKRLWDLATKQKKEVREELEAQIQELKEQLRSSKAEVVRENLLKERAQRASQICSKAWKEKCDELNTNKELASYWKEQYESLKSQSMGWLNRRKHLNEILDEYECTINLLHPSVVAYHTKLATS